MSYVSGSGVCRTPENIERTRLSVLDLLNRPAIPKAKGRFSIWPARGSPWSIKVKRTARLRPWSMRRRNLASRSRNSNNSRSLKRNRPLQLRVLAPSIRCGPFLNLRVVPESCVML